MTHPARKRILLAVTGLSPQVVTETLYALCVTATPRWIPDEIHLISSREGAERARLALLDPHSGQFHAFCRDYPQAAAICFTPEQIHLIAPPEGQAIGDIRTPEDNTHAANTIHALVRQFTADPQSELHVSIAGGRKTMGFYLGYSLSLTARPQDRLSHVLVSEPFESLPDFYYPPANPRVLHTRQGRPIHTADATIMLAEIPFVRLRPLLPEDALGGQLSFSDSVAATQAHLATPQLAIDSRQRRIECGHRQLTLPPQLFAWYRWFAERARDRLPPIRYTDADPATFLACYAETIGSDAVDYEITAKMLSDEGISKEFFEQKCAKVNRHLKHSLGPSAAAPYLIAPSGQRPHTRYQIKLNPEEIRIEKLAHGK